MSPLSILFTVFSCAALATSAPHVKRAQTVYLAGDSTMAKQSSNIQGTSIVSHVKFSIDF